jgi:hypothetical protein
MLSAMRIVSASEDLARAWRRARGLDGSWWQRTAGAQIRDSAAAKATVVLAGELLEVAKQFDPSLDLEYKATDGNLVNEQIARSTQP